MVYKLKKGDIQKMDITIEKGINNPYAAVTTSVGMVCLTALAISFCIFAYKISNSLQEEEDNGRT